MNPNEFLSKLDNLFGAADRKQHARHREHERRMQSILQDLIERPFSRWLRDDATSVTGVNVVLDLGSPPAGTEWRVRNITVTGADPTASVALAEAQVFRGDPGAFTLIDAGSNGTGGALVPNTTFYGVGELTIKATDRLVIGVNGAVTNGTRLFAAALVEQVPIGSLPGDSLGEEERPAVTELVGVTAAG